MKEDYGYEPAEVIEIGQAQEIILGVKDLTQEDNCTNPPYELFPCEFARFDE